MTSSPLPENVQTKRSTSSLVLGTVQFGMEYGVSNRRGRPDTGQVRDILDLAFERGIRVLDTAAAYGESESVLGACGMGRWSVVTKLPSLAAIEDAKLGACARETVERSLDRLGVETLYALLAHDHRDMIGERGRRLRDALEPLIEKGRIARVGVSVYGAEDLSGIEEMNAQVVQAPLNVFDQRFVASGAGARVNAAGGELHVRSVFLQGLLLMQPEERPARFAPWSKHLSLFDEYVRDSALDRVSFCLGYVSRQQDVGRCVVGVETAQQLTQLLDAFEAGQQSDIDVTELRSSDPQLFDPRQWQDK